MLELLPVLAAITPFILWPFVYLIPLPHIIEELAKLFLARTTRSTKSFPFLLILGSGVLFAVSETVLYSIGLFQTSTLQIIGLRLLLTTTLHTLTLLGFGIAVRKHLIFQAVWLICAIFIHYHYNRFVTQL